MDNKWISVEDKLPDYGKRVLVSVRGNVVITHRTKNDYAKDKYDFVHITFTDDVTYWMELPTPPLK